MFGELNVIKDSFAVNPHVWKEPALIKTLMKSNGGDLGVIEAKDSAYLAWTCIGAC